MTFKEYVIADNEHTFFSCDEFEITVNINGVNVKVIEDAGRLDEIRRDVNSLIIGDILFYINESEYAKIPNLKAIPVGNQAIKYNGRPVLIIDAKKYDGIYEIILNTAGG